MSLGLHETRQRRRRQRRWTVIKTLVLIALLGGAFWISYQSGNQLAQAEVDALRRQLQEAKQQILDLQDESGRLAADLTSVTESQSELQARYERDVPKGAIARILDLAEAKLAEGVPAERLTFVVSSVQKTRNCQNEPVTKRFLVRTPLYQGANDSVAFDNGTITVSASGETATDAAGNPEAWFDPAKAVQILVTEIGGASTGAQGMLPLHFSLVRGSVEHRFSARAGESRGFVTVTEDRCAYP